MFQIELLYKEQLTTEKLLTKDKHLYRRKPVFFFQLLVSSGSFWIAFFWLDNPVAKIIVGIFGMATFVFSVISRNRYENKRLRKLEKKYNVNRSETRKMSFRARLLRVKAAIFIQHNKQKLRVNKRDIQSLKEEFSRRGTDEKQYSIPFPFEFLALTAAVVSILLILFDPKDWSEETRSGLATLIFSVIALVVAVWAMSKPYIESWINCEQTRNKRISEILGEIV